jgi:Thioesterase-like superfamily
MTARHPFDEAMKLEAAGAGKPHTWLGTASQAYWNMVGPFGGTTAAVALQSVLQHPDLLGEPIALTVNYAAALGAGPFRIVTCPARTNRSTQHWVIELTQADDTGQSGVVLTATALTALRRETWGEHDLPMPASNIEAAIPRPAFSNVEWTQRYEFRFAGGLIPDTWDGAKKPSLTQLWLRDQPPRPLDFASLAAMADAFYPRVWLRRATRVPAGTVSITTYFHASSAELKAVGTGYLFGQAKGQAFHNGFFDQTAQLWSEQGALLATSNQIVYYKE